MMTNFAGVALAAVMACAGLLGSRGLAIAELIQGAGYDGADDTGIFILDYDSTTKSGTLNLTENLFSGEQETFNGTVFVNVKVSPARPSDDYSASAYAVSASRLFFGINIDVSEGQAEGYFFTKNGSYYLANSFVAGPLVSTVPIPSALPLSAVALIALGGIGYVFRSKTPITRLEW